MDDELKELEKVIARETRYQQKLPLPDDYFADDIDFKDTLRWDKENSR